MNENKRTNTKKNITISRIKRTQRPTIILSYLLVTEQDQTQKNKLLENINRLPAEKALEINDDQITFYGFPRIFLNSFPSLSTTQGI